MTRYELVQRLDRIFIHQWNVYTEYPTYLTDKADSVKRFAEGLAQMSGKEVYFEGPQNIDNYYRLQICLTPGLPPNRFTLEFDDVARAGEVIYLNVICSVVAPVSEASWHIYRVEQGQLVLESYDLLDPAWLSRHPELKSLALETIRIGDMTNLPVLGWDISRQRAEARWPLPPFAPEDAQLRHFLFGGYYDD